MDSDYIVIGGGVVGLSIAWGLLKRGHKVIVIDGDDTSYRASRGNFGLIWVQSKGLEQPAYARWSQRSAAKWADFATELQQHTGYDLALVQNGGYDFHFDEESLEDRKIKYEALKKQLDGEYPFEVLDSKSLKIEEPNIGPGITAIFHQQDGHVNPLKLLKALADDVCRMGATLTTGTTVVDVKYNHEFEVICEDDRIFRASKVVLAAGLGSDTLGPKLGFKARVQPQRGQIIVTEKLPKLVNRPSGIIRQVDEGGIQLGDSKEDVGFDDSVTVNITATIAARAVKVYPVLAKAKIVRSWAALRVMSPDGLPIYQQSTTQPGAYLVTCHSGVTLAAAHANFLPDWIEANESAPDLEVFSEQRFTVC